MEKKYSLTNVIVYWIQSILLGTLGLFAINILPCSIAYLVIKLGYSTSLACILAIANHIFLAIAIGTNLSLVRALKKGSKVYKKYKEQERNKKLELKKNKKVKSHSFKVGDVVILPEFDSISDDNHSTNTPQNSC